MLKATPSSDGIELEELQLTLVEQDRRVDPTGEICLLRMAILDASGTEASVIAIYRDERSNYKIFHRKTDKKFRRQGLASLLLEKSIKHISNSRPTPEAILYIDTNQKSVISWSDKHGFIPDIAIDKWEINYEQDGDICYRDKVHMSKTMRSVKTHSEVDRVRDNLDLDNALPFSAASQ